MNETTTIKDKIYFSQNEEEKIINKYLDKDPDGSEKGTYVDIGAGDPVMISNTYYYYWRGWNGILIEPHPTYAKRIKEMRPRDIFLPIAIHNCDGEIEMCDTATIGSYIGDDYKSRLQKKKDLFIIKCMTINSLIKKYPDFSEPDFCNIDVETNEDKVLEKCDFTKFKPKIICIEDFGTYRGFKDERFEWKHYLTPFYDFKETATNNLIYVRKK